LGGDQGRRQLRPAPWPWLLELGESYWRWEKGSIDSRGRRLASGARSPAAQSSWGRAAEGDRRCSVLRLEEEEWLGLWLVCTATSCGWCEVSRCSTRLNLQAAKVVRGEKNLGRRTMRGDDGTATSQSSKAGRTIRPAVGHDSGVDCGGRPGWSDVHEGVVELLLLSLSARGVLSSSAATCPSPAARRLLGARSTCTTRCVDGASKAEKAVADNL